MYLKSFVLLVVFSLGTRSEPVRYDNYHLYRVVVENTRQLDVLQEVENYGNGYIFLDSPVQSRMNVSILVPPHKLAGYEQLRADLGLTSQLSTENFQAIIDAESHRPLGKSKRSEGFGWDQYQSLEAIYEWLDGLVDQYSSILTLQTIGQTYEGRDMRLVRLSQRDGNRGIFIEANIHAREWITSATATWLLNELLTSQDPAVQDLAMNYDWYILPVANPDGFHYSHTTNRLWRKNRYPHTVLCAGVDLNRNFPYHWMEGGASPIACNDIFAGPQPASEIETKNTIAYYETIVDQIELHLQFHSYGQYILLPYGYQDAPYPDNYFDQMEIAEAAAIGFSSRYDTLYTFGTIADVLYVDSGSTTDWSHGYHNTPLSMCFEFRDNGPYGFVLPPDQIIPNSEETLDALVAMLARAKTMGYFQRS